MKKGIPIRRSGRRSVPSRTASRDPLLPRGTRARRRVAYLGAATTSAFILLMLAVFGGSALHTVALRSPQVAAVVSAVLVDLANADRAQVGVGSLSVNATLVAVAQAKANDMAAKSYFAHTSPDGLDPWHWFKQQGYAFSYAGENLAVDFSDSADVERAWMNSPTHRQNLLDPHYTEVGIATAQGMYQGRLTTFVVQAFGTPSRTAAAPQKIAVADVPAAPTEVATAIAEPAVLGSATAQQQEIAAVPVASRAVRTPVAEKKGPTEGASPSMSVATTEPALAGALAEEAHASRPLWSFAAAFPRATARYAYYVLGILILLALGFETGLELRWHHRRHAARAGALLAVLGLLFFAADAIFFTKPVLAAVAAVF